MTSSTSHMQWQMPYEFFTSVAATYRKGTDANAVSAPNFAQLKALINSKVISKNKFEIPDIMQKFVLNYLSKLQGGKITDLDGISARLLHAAVPAMTSSSTKVINLSISTGKFLAWWKEVTVCPVYKAGHRLRVDNYHPISILFILSKVLGTHVHTSMYEYLIKHNLLSIHQPGFHPYHSCTVIQL